jgi:hypothetical protein
VTSKPQLIDLEFKVTHELEMNFQYESVIPFLERFQRFYRLDQEKSCESAKQIGYAAR